MLRLPHATGMDSKIMGERILHTRSDERHPEPVAPGRGPFAIARPVLHESVTHALRKMIVEGSLAPGARLNERNLCAALGVSRTPLREALKVLAAEGLIDHQPNRGAVVAVMSEDDIGDTFDLLGCLEGFAGELACAKITAAELNELKALHYSMLACHSRGDLPGYYEYNQAVHDRINLLAGNAMLRQTYLTLNLRVQGLRFRSNHDAQKWARAVAEHGQMIEALEARDGARLAKLMRQHLDEKKEAVLAAIRGDAGPAA
jgi:DNA-binding GntR family transcriptional regulator